jgi:Fe2+ or Zn2+ uptake regulation protein
MCGKMQRIPSAKTTSGEKRYELDQKRYPKCNPWVGTMSGVWCLCCNNILEVLKTELDQIKEEIRNDLKEQDFELKNGMPQLDGY